MSKFCPECGSANQDEAMFCTNCGTPFSASSKAASKGKQRSVITAAEGDPFSSDTVKPKSPKKRFLPILIICVAAVAVIAIVLASMFFTGSFDKMTATSKAGKGDYAGALESYEKYLSRSGKESSEAITQAAVYALSAGDADKALMYAKSVPEKTAESTRVEDLASIALARDAMKSENWTKVISLLENCSDSDGKDLLKEARYNYGVELMSSEKWEDAAEQFEKTDYADSKDLLEECNFKVSVDAHFLSDLVTFCTGLINAESESEEIGSLLAKLEPYESSSFTDKDLEKYALAFISDMRTYADILNSSGRMYNKQLKECTPMGDASSQLIRINKLYPFDKAVWSEISDYYSTPEHWNELAAVVRQLSSDMASKARSGYYSNKQQFIRVPNNTSYVVDVTFFFYCYDSKGNFSSFDFVSATLAKGTKTQVVFNCNASTERSWDYDFYVTDFR